MRSVIEYAKPIGAKTSCSLPRQAGAGTKTSVCRGKLDSMATLSSQPTRLLYSESSMRDWKHNGKQHQLQRTRSSACVIARRSKQSIGSRGPRKSWKTLRSEIRSRRDVRRAQRRNPAADEERLDVQASSRFYWQGFFLTTRFTSNSPQAAARVT